LLCNFCSTYIIYKCGRGTHNTSWWAAGFRRMAYVIFVCYSTDYSCSWLTALRKSTLTLW
jgi:hypothetical protein